MTARGRLLYGPRALLKDRCNIDLLTQEMCFKKKERGEQKRDEKTLLFPMEMQLSFCSVRELRVRSIRDGIPRVY